jgi:hypothetical protein
VYATEPVSLQALCESVPREQLEQVHVFFVNGCDPAGVAGMRGLCEHVRALGFVNAEYGQMFHTRSFHQKIQSVKAAQPHARIALCGYSLGANRVCDLSHQLDAEGIAVDLLVYIGADALANSESSRPLNVGKLVNITGHGSIFFGGDLVVTPNHFDGAENLHLQARHFGLPRQSETIEVVVRQLLALVSQPAVKATAAPTPAARSAAGQLRIP